MNNLQNKIKQMFEENDLIHHEINSLTSNGVFFDCSIEFSKDTFEIKLSSPVITKSYIQTKQLLNSPKLDLKDFKLNINDMFEFEKPNKQSFIQSAIKNGFNTNTPNFENIVDETYQNAIKSIQKTEIMTMDSFLITANAGLGFLQEAIGKFNSNTLNFIEDYNSNISKNRFIIQTIIDKFKSSSSKKQALSFFKDKYYNSILLKKTSLLKLQKNIDTIRQSPWYSFASVLSRLKLFLEDYENKKQQYTLLKQKEQQIYNELEEAINEAYENLILDQQQLLHNQELNTNIDIDQYELYKYTLPIYNQILQKHNLKYKE